MLLLIGSRALVHHLGVEAVGREPSDWDFITDYHSVRAPVKLIRPGKAGCPELKCEFYVTIPGVYNTDQAILDYCSHLSMDIVKTPIGMAHVAPLSILKILKLATAGYLEKTKHYKDLDGPLEPVDVYNDVWLYTTMKIRLQETKDRLASEATNFLDKYKIPRVIPHDKLHEYISAPAAPAYLSALARNSVTEIDKDTFTALEYPKKINIALEEILVLALERDILPKIRKAPHLSAYYLDKVFSGDSSSSAVLIKWLDRLSYPGKLQDHPEWLANWYYREYGIIRGALYPWAAQTIDKLPEQFWREVLG